MKRILFAVVAVAAFAAAVLAAQQSGCECGAGDCGPACPCGCQGE